MRESGLSQSNPPFNEKALKLSFRITLEEAVVGSIVIR